MTSNQIIINKIFKVSVSDLTDDILQNKDDWYNYVINLPLSHQIVYTTVIFNQQVFNGGLHQYFFNSYGQLAYLTLDYLKVFGAAKTAAILNRALAKVNSHRYGINEFREKIFNRELREIVDFDENLMKALDELDAEYYSLDEDLEQLIIDYLKISQLFH